jgi:hypothetical protein
VHSQQRNNKYFFCRKININVRLSMLENYDFPQLEGNAQITFQEDGEPKHFGNAVGKSLNDQFPNKWMGR